MRALSKILAVCMTCLSITAHAKDLYVNATTGNDSVTYAGNSASTPWRTLGRALWGSVSISGPNATQAARAGDTVLVAAGTYNTNAVTNSRLTPIYNPVNSGTAGSPITIRAQGTVHLQSSNSSGTQPIVGTFDRSHIVWDGFTVNEQTVPTRADTGPAVIWASQNVTMQNMTVIGVVKNWGDNHTGIRVENANDIIVRNNRIQGFSDDHGGAITTYRTGRLLLEHNDISDSQDGIFIKGENQGPVTIRMNRVNNTKNAIMFGGIGLSGSMSYVYQNLVTNASLGGVIFIGYDSLTPAHVTVANNTIDAASPASDGGGILLRPGFDGYRNIVFRNNLVTNSAAGVTAWGVQLNATNFSHNNYYGNQRVAWINYTDLTLNGWRSSYAQDTSGTLTSNPQYRAANDFRLSGTSSLLTAGVDLLDLDDDGSTTDAIAMGAYITGNEQIGITTNTPTTTLAPPNPPTNVTIMQ